MPNTATIQIGTILRRGEDFFIIAKFSDDTAGIISLKTGKIFGELGRINDLTNISHEEFRWMSCNTPFNIAREILLSIYTGNSGSVTKTNPVVSGFYTSTDEIENRSSDNDTIEDNIIVIPRHKNNPPIEQLSLQW